jgi:hypothetical protein
MPARNVGDEQSARRKQQAVRVECVVDRKIVKSGVAVGADERTSQDSEVEVQAAGTRGDATYGVILTAITS